MSFAEPSAVHLPQPPTHGERPSGLVTPRSAVAQALAELTTLGARPLAEHPDVYQSIHAELQGALADIDDA